MRIVVIVIGLGIAAFAIVASVMSPRVRAMSFIALLFITFSAWYFWPQIAEGVASPCGAAALAQMGAPSSAMVPEHTIRVRARTLSDRLQQEHPHIPVQIQCVAAYYRYRYR